MSDIAFDRDEAQAAFLDGLPFDPPQGAQFSMRLGPDHQLGPTYRVGELVTMHGDDTPTLGATWLFDNGDDVTIALVLGWDDVHWFVQDAEGACRGLPGCVARALLAVPALMASLSLSCNLR
jgi:hypothetical protein